MGEKVPDTTNIAKLLKNPPDEEAGFCDALRTIPDEKRTWEDVQTRLHDEYERKQATQKIIGSNSNSMALYSKEQRTNVVYHKCGKKGHVPRFRRGKAQNEDAEKRSESKSVDSMADDASGSSSRAKKARRKNKAVTTVMMAKKMRSESKFSFVIDSGASGKWFKVQRR